MNNIKLVDTNDNDPFDKRIMSLLGERINNDMDFKRTNIDKCPKCGGDIGYSILIEFNDESKMCHHCAFYKKLIDAKEYDNINLLLQSIRTGKITVESIL